MKTIIINAEKLNALKEAKEFEDFAAKDEFKLSKPENETEYIHVTEETNPEDIDLSSFKLKDTLYPKFWKNDKLDSRVRLKLLDISDDFIDFLGISWVRPNDIVITGSLANYNWSSNFSDIDLHIIMDYNDIDENKEFVEKYLKSQTILWNGEHEDLKIYGFPIEIYVQDKDSELHAGGVFSLEKNEWIKEPEEDDLKDIGVNKNWIQRRVASYMNKIDDIEDKFNSKNKNEYFLEKLDLKLDRIFSDIKKDRENGFKTGGDEMNDKNIVFKTLRRQGYIQKIKDLKKYIYNITNSL